MVKKEQKTRLELKKNIVRNKYIYLMILPVLVWYIIFHYIPMLGSVIAFQDYKPAKGFLQSRWVGLKHFIDFFKGPYAWRLIRNTLLLNIYQIVFGFPAPIILALLINEVQNRAYKKTIQTISYMPHFISIVVVCGLLNDFSRTDGLFNVLLAPFGFETRNLLSDASLFRTIFTASGIWQSVGWGSIIYLATLSTVDPTLYEAAKIDGAGRWRQVWNISLPALFPVITIQFIMRMGNIMTQGYEKVILLYNPLTYETADVLSSYVYRRGLIQMDFSFGAAVGIFNSIVNILVLVIVNGTFRRKTGDSLW
ncbi:MAG: ABC transporter permease [Bullifex sp.]